MLSLMARRQREGNLSASALVRRQKSFLVHVQKYYTVRDIDADVLAQARQLVVRHPLRTLDAIQLASALTAQTVLGVRLTFISADARLLGIAASEGLATDDPNLHP